MCDNFLCLCLFFLDINPFSPYFITPPICSHQYIYRVETIEVWCYWFYFLYTKGTNPVVLLVFDQGKISQSTLVQVQLFWVLVIIRSIFSSLSKV